ELSKFVAKPTTDIEKPSPHLSGGAVDLTISGPNGWLEMGTDFDDFTELAMTRHFEELSSPTEKEIGIRNNRRLLYHLMIQVGFTNYSHEWWHYEYGTRSWARQTNGQPIYGGILSMNEKVVE
ncbi:MAG: D-alanyl-D-alanine dipeptidase, partial [Brevibacillus sp.]|nr:D-alanyl-D-alanine dipeptidase [Brevibacillus sp.]